MKQCKLEDCDNQVNRHSAKGYCGKHYQRVLYHGDPYKTLIPYKRHGLSKKNNYDTWCNMKQRCYSNKSSGYEYYGGRGIKICDRWINSFANFYEDMGDKPKGKSIERLNNDGDYSPENCIWATHVQQERNKRVPRNNTSGYKGVYRRADKWQASISINGKNKHLGFFNDIEDAVNARKLGELNFYS